MNVLLALAIASAPSSAAIFVDGAAAEALFQREASILDARGEDAKAPYLPGAHVVDWMSMRDGSGRTGRLDDDLERLKKKLEAVGVSSDRPVLVYGAMRDGWGEEGRIWWTLRYLGHPDVHILDGGIGLWVKEGRKTDPTPDKSTKKIGGLIVKPVAKLRADWRAVDEARKKKSARVIDSRTVEEWNGATPHMEWRGGHVPGAEHLEWSRMIGPDGRLLTRDQVIAQLKSIGVDGETPVITYCTGGVRSAFLQAVLMNYGFTDVANYDGSWFDWSRRSELPIALTPRLKAD